MKNLIEYILIHIVQHPDDISISEVQEAESSFVYNITAHQEDIGRIIGKKGSVIQSLRTIAKMRAVKENIRVQINIDDSVQN